jgi:hypothetical protein
MGYDPNIEYVKAALKDKRMRDIDMPGSMYQEWDNYARAHGGLGPDYVYPNPEDARYSDRGHLTDKGKLPWHPTFSDESDYAGLAPHGSWNGTTFVMTPEMVNEDRLGKMVIMKKNGEPETFMLPDGTEVTRDTNITKIVGGR